MADLAELLERVKAATGPDRALDGQIEVAVRWIEAARVGLAPEHRAPWKHDALGHVYDPHTAYRAEAVTTSLDAALALVDRVLPGWDCSAVRIVDAPAEGYVWPHRQSMAQHQGVGATPALALLAALLSALIAQPASGDVGSAKLTRDA